jgi:hypothetical protein
VSLSIQYNTRGAGGEERAVDLDGNKIIATKALRDKKEMQKLNFKVQIAKLWYGPKP